MPKILFVGGGSIGHIAPAVAVWRACETRVPKSSAHFVCSPRPDDAAFLEKNNLSYTVFNAPRASILLPFTFGKAVHRAKKILDTHSPDIIFSKGGYVSLPLCYAAYRRGIPIVTHESDSVSGYANKIIARMALHICTGFPSISTFQHFNISTFTGNPVRPELTEGSRKKALRILGFEGSRPILLVTGGSQGSQAINDVVSHHLDDLLLRCDIIHITGRGKSPTTDNRQPTTGHYYQTEFAHEELAHFYAAADVALSRAGAGNIAELAANGIPSILVPLRKVGHDHQYTNAVIAAKSGGCIRLEQSDMQQKLLGTVHALVADKKKRSSMAKNIRTLYKQDAAVQIAKIIARTLDSGQRNT